MNSNIPNNLQRQYSLQLQNVLQNLRNNKNYIARRINIISRFLLNEKNNLDQMPENKRFDIIEEVSNSIQKNKNNNGEYKNIIEDDQEKLVASKIRLSEKKRNRKTQNAFKQEIVVGENKQQKRESECFQCTFKDCPKKFTSKHNLKIHYRWHTGERPYKCINCYKCFYDNANYKYHLRTGHLQLNEMEKKCSHDSCQLHCKTKKKKNLHHQKFDPECHEEKTILMQLISKYKDILKIIIRENNIDKNILNSLNEYKDLHKEWKNVSMKVSDIDYFSSIVGKNLDF